MKRLFYIVFLLLSVLHHGCIQPAVNLTAKSDPWLTADSILKQIQPPVFPGRTFNILSYGAKNDGKTNCSKAFQKAITACHQAGGGKVLVPPGKYYSGPIYLKSNVNLHLEKGAVILFSVKPEDYLPLVYTRWEGVELMNYSPLIYAFEEENIALTGEGILDGQAGPGNWWTWKGKAEYGWKEGMPNQTDPGKRDLLFKMGENGTPVKDRIFGQGAQLRPQFVQPYRCSNVLIEGITIINSPMWVLNPVLCTNVTISKVTINSEGPNSDGCDPESCKNVIIKDCYFNTGDDCIAIKSGRNADGRRINIASENIIIQNCTMANGHGGIVLGSEISGGVHHVFAENCTMSSPELDRALRIKTSSMRGGITEHIYLRNIEVGQVKEQALIATMLYEDSGSFLPVIRNIEVRNMTVKQAGKTGILLEAYNESPIENFRLVDCKIDGAETPYLFSNVRNISLENVTINGIVITDSQIGKETKD